MGDYTLFFGVSFSYPCDGQIAVELILSFNSKILQSVSHKEEI